MAYAVEPDDSSTEAGAPEAKPEENQYAEYLARILGHGERAMSDVSTEVMDEIHAAMALDREEALREHFVRIGSFMSLVASMEDNFVPLATFLLNPSQPGRAAPAVMNLGAAQVRALVQTLLDPRWPATQAVFSECAAIAQFRNRLAHNGLSPFWVEEDGSRLVQRVHIENSTYQRGAFTHERIQLPLDVLDEWRDRALLAGKVAMRILMLLSELAFVGYEISPDWPLNMIFLDPEQKNDQMWSERDKDLFSRFYGPVE
jgi:hypothetical protein